MPNRKQEITEDNYCNKHIHTKEMAKEGEHINILKEDKKKRKTWVWVPIVEKVETDGEVEVNNSGRAKRSSMRKASENITATISKKQIKNKKKISGNSCSSEINDNSNLGNPQEDTKEGNNTLDGNLIQDKISDKGDKDATQSNTLDYDKTIQDDEYKDSQNSEEFIIVVDGMESITTSINSVNIDSNHIEPCEHFVEIVDDTNNSIGEKSIPMQETEDENTNLIRDKADYPIESSLEINEVNDESKRFCDNHMDNILPIPNKQQPDSFNLIESGQNGESKVFEEKIIEKISITQWPPLPQYKKIDENLLLCKDAESKELKSLQCECNPTSKEKKRGRACSEECLNRLLLMECGEECRAGKYCTNMRFQKKEYSDVEVFFTGAKGWGLRAKKDISNGEFIIEYLGEIINSKEMSKRIKRYGRDPNHKHHYLMALRSGTVIDATTHGNVGRFINHSCDPNAITQKWTVGRQLRIGFFALKPILSGEEITFNYQFERYGRRAQKCFCMSQNCTGFIGASKEDSGMESDEECFESDSNGSDKTSSDEDETERKGPHATKLASDSRMPVLSNRKIRKYPKSSHGLLTRGIIYGKRHQNKDDMIKCRIRPDQITDPTLREQAEVSEIILRGPLRNRDQVLEFNRLMVRVDQQESRRRMVDYLSGIEDPNILRLFIANQGLALIRIWFVLPPFERRALQLQSQIARLLMRLPVTNKNQVDEVCIMSTLKQMLTLELPDKFIVRNVMDQIIDEVCLAHDDPGPNLTKSSQKSIVLEFDTLKNLAANLADKWESLVDWEFRIPKKLVKHKSNGKEEGKSRSKHERFLRNTSNGKRAYSSYREKGNDSPYDEDEQNELDMHRGRYRRFQRHYRKFLPLHFRHRFNNSFAKRHYDPDLSSVDHGNPSNTGISREETMEEENNAKSYYDANEPPPSFFNIPSAAHKSHQVTKEINEIPTSIGAPPPIQTYPQGNFGHFYTMYSPSPYYIYGGHCMPMPTPIYYDYAPNALPIPVSNFPPPPPPIDKPVVKQETLHEITEPNLKEVNEKTTAGTHENATNISDKQTAKEIYDHHDKDKNAEQKVSHEIKVETDTESQASTKTWNSAGRERGKAKSSKDIQVEMLQRRLQSLRAVLGQKASPSQWPSGPEKDNIPSKNDMKNDKQKDPKKNSRSSSRNMNQSPERHEHGRVENKQTTNIRKNDEKRRDDREKEKGKFKEEEQHERKGEIPRSKVRESQHNYCGKIGFRRDSNGHIRKEERQRHSISPQRNGGRQDSSRGRENNFTGNRRSPSRNGKQHTSHGRVQSFLDKRTKRNDCSERIRDHLIKKALDEQNKEKRDDKNLNEEDKKQRQQLQEKNKAIINEYTERIRNIVQTNQPKNQMHLEHEHQRSRPQTTDSNKNLVISGQKQQRQRGISESSVSSTTSTDSLSSTTSSSSSSSTTTTSSNPSNGIEEAVNIKQIENVQTETISADNHQQHNLMAKNPIILDEKTPDCAKFPKIQSFRINPFNPSINSSSSVQNNVSGKGHFLTTVQPLERIDQSNITNDHEKMEMGTKEEPDNISSDEDEENGDEMMQPPRINAGILQDPNQFDAYIHQLKEFVYFMETMRRDMHGPVPYPTFLMRQHQQSSFNSQKFPPTHPQSLLLPNRLSSKRVYPETKQQEQEDNEKPCSSSSIKERESGSSPPLKLVRLEIDHQQEPIPQHHKKFSNLVQHEQFAIHDGNRSSHSNTPPEDPAINRNENSNIANEVPNIYVQTTRNEPDNVDDIKINNSHQSSTVDCYKAPNSSVFKKVDATQQTVENTVNEENHIAINPSETHTEVPSTSIIAANIVERPNSSMHSAVSTTPLMSKSGLWLVASDADGTLYYYHRDTRETRWDLPEGEELIFQPSIPPAGQTIQMPDMEKERQKRRAEFKRQVSSLAGKCIESYRKRFFSSSNEYAGFLRKITHKVLQNQESNPELLFNDQVQKNTRRLVEDYIHHFKHKESSSITVASVQKSVYQTPE